MASCRVSLIRSTNMLQRTLQNIEGSGEGEPGAAGGGTGREEAVWVHLSEPR